MLASRRARWSVVLGVAALVACGDASHVFEGRLYREGRACLAGRTSVDVVEGETGGNCGPICLAQPLVDGGRALYASTMCAPFPFMFDASGSDPACPAVLGALDRNDGCLADGGSTNPPPPPELPPDSGPDATL